MQIEKLLNSRQLKSLIMAKVYMIFIYEVRYMRIYKDYK